MRTAFLGIIFLAALSASAFIFFDNPEPAPQSLPAPPSVPFSQFSLVVDTSQSTTDAASSTKETEGVIETMRVGKIETKAPVIPRGPAAPLDDDACAKIIAMSPLWHDPELQAVRIEREIRAQGRIEEATLLRAISCVPQAFWMNSNSPERDAALQKALGLAEEAKKIPVIVIYNKPGHDTAEWGSGIQAGGYRARAEKVARMIGNKSAIVILEPDAVPLAVNLPPHEQAQRLADIRAGVEALAEFAPRTRVYIDAGHSAWHPAAKIAPLLREAGIEKARGISLNIANYRTSAESIFFAKEIARIVPGLHVVIDTGRNGAGSSPLHEWCNAEDRSLGTMPALVSDDSIVDAYLWVKPPGESDGTCNGGPSPGKFWLDYALELVKNTGFNGFIP